MSRNLPHHGSRRPRARWLVMVLLLCAPTALWAHLQLRASSPASGDELNRAPQEVRLTFTLPVTLPLSQVTLTGPDGPVALGEPRLEPGTDNVLVAPVTDPLTAGSYTVQWLTAGTDGHPIRGEFSFALLPGAEGLASAADPSEPARPAPEPSPPGPAPADAATARFNAESPLYVAVRWLTFLGLLVSIGAAAFCWLVLPLTERRAPGVPGIFVAEAARSAARVGLLSAVVLVVALALRLYAQSAALYGAEQAWNGERIAVLLGQTAWGWGWLLQALATVVALLGFAWARTGSRPGWVMAAAGAAVLAFTPALAGHAMGAEPQLPAVIADGLHVLGAGGWLGSLLLVMAAGVPAATRLSPPERGRTIAALTHAFSPTALLFAGLVVVTGVFAAWLHLGSLATLWNSEYGRVLLIKLVVLTLVFATGAYNWLRVRPALGTDPATHRLRRSATLELAVGVVVLAVTAVLVATPPPAEEASATEAGRSPAAGAAAAF